MSRRTAFVRCLALFWAVLQVASPGFSAIADGRLATEAASGASTHVESKTTASCPAVHPPDCGICRYLSGSASDPAPAPLGFLYSPDASEPTAQSCVARGDAVALPHGRAPPSI
ncbi:MAG: hypothetical protein WD825_05345 [Gemmatimonadaceae bacterium]